MATGRGAIRGNLEASSGSPRPRRSRTTSPLRRSSTRAPTITKDLGRKKGHLARLAEQFDDLDQQEHANRLGMWVFLGSETLLFAALFELYWAYRQMYGDAFSMAARQNHVVLGTLNTVVLLTSSL